MFHVFCGQKSQKDSFLFLNKSVPKIPKKMSKTEMMTGEIMKNGVLQDLDEDVVITLTAKNPQAPQNIIRFDHTIGEYVTVKLAESMIDHLEIESTSIHKDSDEGQKQLMNEGKKQDGKKHFF